MLVLEVISELCRDPLALVEMFVNYDCDLQAIDLFKRIITALAKVSSVRLNLVASCVMCFTRAGKPGSFMRHVFHADVPSYTVVARK